MLRIGILGAARIAPAAVIKPAKEHAEVTVAAVAARDQAKAQAFATKHGIPKVHTSYDALINDPDIDAIYNPLPNGLHGHWTIKALEANKHVLCEKPFTANAEEAEGVVAVANAHPALVVMEAFHWRYHPLAQSLVDIVASGELGDIERITTAMCIPLPLRNDIRFQSRLAGGSLMDVGCYAIHKNRTLAGKEPTVVSARAKTLKRDPKIDRWITSELAYPTGTKGTIHAALWSSQLLRITIKVVGTKGELRVFNATQPALYHRASVHSGGTKRSVKSLDKRSSYWHQLDAFAATVGGAADRNITGLGNAVANMRVVDAIYEAAGMAPRQPTSL